MDIPYTLTARPDTGLYNGKLGVWLFLASEVMLFGALFTAYLFMRLGAPEGTWPTHIQSIPLGLTNTGLLIVSSITMVYAWVALKERNFNKYRIFLAVTILCGLLFLGIKGIEYHSKFVHTGALISASAYPKYKDQIEKTDAFVSWIPEEKLYEVRGHREVAEEKPDNYVILLDQKFHPVGAGPKTEVAEEEQKITLDRKDVERIDSLLPSYGTYYAIYFTVTGLHALHIIGGVVVMLYFLGPGAALYRSNPEHLANRVEVTGIFWHFVDLVWITVFPILYLT